MAPTTNISNINKTQELSIQVSLNGLSFCILQKDTHTISIIKHVKFAKKLNPFEVLEKLTHVFKTD